MTPAELQEAKEYLEHLRNRRERLYILQQQVESEIMVLEAHILAAERPCPKPRSLSFQDLKAK